MRNSNLILSLLIVTLVGLAVLDLCCGSTWLPLSQCFQEGTLYQQIFLNIRLPKALTAILAGVALSVSGLMMQTLFRNPLAGPYILGVSSGASLGVALLTMLSGIVISPLSFVLAPLSTAIAAIIGSALVLLLMLLIARRIRSNVTLLIVGMMVGAIAGALVGVIQNYADPDSLKLFIVWTLGSLQGVGWNEMTYLLPIILCGLVGALCLIKPLNGLLLGEDYAQGLGIQVKYIRWAIVLVSGLLVGGITAFCGPIAFVGVAVPHIARGLFGTTDHRLTLPACALIGANLLLVCDIVSSLSTYPLPISTLSSLIGAPIIIYVIVRK